jgi:two-component system NtrC family sensor kinase
MKRLRFPDSLTARIAGLFIVFLVAATAIGAVAIREFVRRDLEQAVKGEVLRAQGRLESVIVRIRQEAALFAELGARAEEAEERSQVRGASMVRITLAEQSREKGIHLETLRSGEVPERLAAVFRRGFAGMPTADYVLPGDGPTRVLLVAVAPAGGAERDRKVVTASVTLGREFLRRESRAIGGEAMFFHDGQVVASSSTCLECEACIRRILSDPAQARVLDQGKSIYFTFDCRPEPQAVVAVPLRTYDGKTVVMALSRSTEGERKALLHTTIGLVAGAIGFTAVLGAAFLLLVFRVVRPLRALTQAASAIAEGEYGRMVPVQGGDEVARLGAAFNRMSASMEQAMREISDWNRLLETRVAEKTRELEQVHLRMVEVERLAAMGQVAAGVAHELNNPLSGIMGYSDLALERFRGLPPGRANPGDTEKIVGHIENVSALALRCRNIILDMMKFARQPTEEFSPQDLNALIGETLVFLGHQLTHGKIEVVRDCPEGLPPFRGNALQVQQVFTNILVNAVHAMPGGGVITVRSRREGEFLVAEFTDTGDGIPPSNLRRIFEPFFTTKPVGKGTGLGLSVSHSIVKRHGGEIGVESAVGKGTTFTVRLPMSGDAATPSAPGGDR